MAGKERSDAGSPQIGGKPGAPLPTDAAGPSNGSCFRDAALLEVPLSPTKTPGRTTGPNPVLRAPVRRGRLAAAGADKRAARDAEDRELIRRCQQDPSPHVRAQTVEAFMPLARSLARRYHRGEEPLEDLEQVAALGLLKAIKGFDPDRGSAFASFAVPTIVGELRRHFRDKGWGVRVPRDLQELALAVQRKADQMSTEIGRPPTAEELAGKLGRDVEDVLEAREALRAMRPASLDRPSSAEDDEDDIPMARIGGIDPGYERTEEAVTIGRLVRGPPGPGRKNPPLRFGGDPAQPGVGRRRRPSPG